MALVNSNDNMGIQIARTASLLPLDLKTVITFQYRMYSTFL